MVMIDHRRVQAGLVLVLVVVALMGCILGQDAHLDADLVEVHGGEHGSGG